MLSERNFQGRRSHPKNPRRTRGSDSDRDMQVVLGLAIRDKELFAILHVRAKIFYRVLARRVH
jgi:hypothetical protein